MNFCQYSLAGTGSIDEAAATYMAEDDIPGMEVVAFAQMLTEDGLKTWSLAHGLANIEQNVPIMTDTYF